MSCSEMIMVNGSTFENGTIVSNDTSCLETNSCNCTEGFFGVNCTVTTCFGIYSNESYSVCSGHGECVEPDVCVCDLGFIGLDCSNNTMHTNETSDVTCFGIPSNDTSLVCSGNGKCVAHDVCVCEEGFIGQSCSTSNISCFGIASNAESVCSGAGLCIAQDICECWSGFTGLNCSLSNTTNNIGNNKTENYYCNEVAYNNQMVCSGHGNCLETGVCNCKSEYYGQDCQFISCANATAGVSNVCYGHGYCIGQTDFLCMCFDGYDGEFCEWSSKVIPEASDAGAPYYKQYLELIYLSLLIILPAIAVTMLVCLIICICGYICWRKRKEHKRYSRVELHDVHI